MFCSKCGTKNNDDAKFCSSCGAAVAAVVATPPLNQSTPNLASSSTTESAAASAPPNEAPKASSSFSLEGYSFKETLLMLAMAAVLIGGGSYYKEIMNLLFKADPGKQASEIVKQQLRSPGSFNYVSSEVLWKGKSSKGEPAYVVSVLYDAQNGLGATLRGCMFASYYETADGQMGWNRDYGVREAPVELCNSSTPAKLKADYAKTLAEVNSFIAQGAPIAAPAASAATNPAVAPNAAPAQPSAAPATDGSEIVVVDEIAQNRDFSLSVIATRFDSAKTVVTVVGGANPPKSGDEKRLPAWM